jgi:uncharacterized protein (DUF433 family)
MSTGTPTDELIARWIGPNPHKPGAAEALVLPRNVSVWALIQVWRLDSQRIPDVAKEFDLPSEAVEAAVRYYRRHKADVDAKIARNDPYFAP